MSELLPCPFCGGEAEFERLGDRRQSCIVACTECGGRHESGDEYERNGESWNRRAQPAGMVSVSRELVEELADDLEAELTANHIPHPVEDRRLDRDMDVVRRARAALEQ